MARLERKRVARAILVCVRSSFLTLLGAGALSLRRVVMLATAAGVILPAVFVGPLVAQESLRSDVQARIHALMAQYGSTLGAALVQPVWLADPVSAEGLLQSVMSNRMWWRSRLKMLRWVLSCQSTSLGACRA